MTSRFGRVSVRPGKHGPGDYRVEFNGHAPTHAEAMYMLGGLLLAEDRYPFLGRYLLMHYLDLICSAKSLEEMADIASGVAEEVSDHGTRRKEPFRAGRA